MMAWSWQTFTRNSDMARIAIWQNEDGKWLAENLSTHELEVSNADTFGECTKAAGVETPLQHMLRVDAERHPEDYQ